MNTLTETQSHIMNLLSLSFTCTKDDDRKKAEDELVQLSTNFDSFFENLLSIIEYENAQKDLTDIKKSASVYLKNITVVYFRQPLKKIEELMKVIERLLKTILSLKMTKQDFKKKIKIISILNSLFFTLISNDLFLSNDNLPKQILTYLVQSLLNLGQEMYTEQAMIIVMLINNVINSKGLVTSNYNDCVQIINNGFNSIFKNVPKYINPSQNKIDLDYVNLIKNLYDTVISIANKLKEIYPNEKRKKMSEIYQKYCEYAYELINLQINNVQNSNNIIYLTDNKELNYSVNLLKAKCIQFITLSVQILEDNSINESILPQIVSLFQLFMNSFDYTIKNNIQNVYKDSYADLQNFEETLNNGWNSILFNLLAFFSRVLVREPIKTQFLPNLNDFILNIIFPNLVPLDYDNEIMKEDEEKYYNIICDLFEHFSYKNYRSASAFLLSKICEKYQDIYLFIISFILQMLEGILIETKEEKNNSIENNLEFRLYTENRNKNYALFKFPKENQIQFCFIILILLRKFLKLNIQFKRTLRKILIDYCNTLNKLSSYMTQEMLCFMYITFIPELFTEDTVENCDFIKEVLEFLLKLILNKNAPTSYIGSQTITNLLDYDSSFISMINVTINSQIGVLIEIFKEVQNTNFFEFMEKVLENITINKADILFSLLTNIITRLQIDISHSNKENVNYFIEKGLDLISAIIKGPNSNILFYNDNDPNNKSSENLNLVNINKFQACVFPIFMYLNNPKKISFDDSIVKIADELVSEVGLNQIASFTFNSTKKIIEENKAISEELYDFLQSFIDIDTKKEGQGENGSLVLANIESLINVLMVSVKYEDEQTSLYSHLLLIKLLSLGQKLEEMTINMLIILSMNSYLQILRDIQNGLIDNSAEVEIYSLNGILGIMLINYPEQTIKSMIKLNYINDLFRAQIYSINEFKFYDEYIVKYIILGLISLLNNACKFPELKSDFFQVNIALIFKILIFQRDHLKADLKNLLKDEIECNFIGDDEDEDDDKNEISLNEKAKKSNEFDELEEYKNLFSELKTKFNQIDEYEQFANFLKNMNSDIVNNFFNGLKENDKVLLKQLLSVRKYGIMVSDEKMFYVPRKIVSVKRHLNNPKTEDGRKGDENK